MILICAALLIAMGIAVSMLTARSIRGFLEDVAKEEREAALERERENDQNGGTESEH